MFKGLCRLTSIAALVCSTFSTALWAESGKQVYTGTLGKTPIVLEVNADGGDDVGGRYFYQKYRKDLMLSGQKDGQTLVLDEAPLRGYQDAPHPTIRLQPKPDGWSGEWRSPEGKVLKVDLQQANIAPAPAATVPFLTTLRDQSPYEYLRLQGLDLKKGKAETFMGYSLQWWIEPTSETTLFEVVSGYTAAERQRINQQLMGRLWQEVAGKFDCEASAGETFYAQTVEPLWMGPSTISVSIATEYSCGGAYTDENDMPLNLDVKTGKTLTLEDVLWLGQGKPLHYEREYNDATPSSESYDAYSDYRTKTLAPWLVQQLSALYPDEMKTTTEREDGCIYGEEQPWAYPSWYFTKSGIKLVPSFPHISSMCRDTAFSVLPYNLIQQHPGSAALQLP